MHICIPHTREYFSFVSPLFLTVLFFIEQDHVFPLSEVSLSLRFCNYFQFKTNSSNATHEKCPE
jgi:hypothetical protein